MFSSKADTRIYFIRINGTMKLFFVSCVYDGRPNDFRTIVLAIILNSSRFSRHVLAASIFAPLSSLGSTTDKLQFKMLVMSGINSRTYQLTLKLQKVKFSQHFVLDSTVLLKVHIQVGHPQAHAKYLYKHDHPWRYLGETFHKWISFLVVTMDSLLEKLV